MALKPGQPAPAFALPEKPGSVVDVGALFGREPVVLLFFPLAYSPVCTEEMCHFRDRWSEWDGLGVRVLGISVDSPFVTARFRADEGIPFPILSDFNKDVSRQYDVLHEELVGLRGVSKRSAFVVGRDGRIAYAWSSDDPRVQVPFDEVKSACAAEGAAKA